jgi:hypothetical protein
LPGKIITLLNVKAFCVIEKPKHGSFSIFLKEYHASIWVNVSVCYTLKMVAKYLFECLITTCEISQCPHKNVSLFVPF